MLLILERTVFDANPAAEEEDTAMVLTEIFEKFDRNKNEEAAEMGVIDWFRRWYFSRRFSMTGWAGHILQLPVTPSGVSLGIPSFKAVGVSVVRMRAGGVVTIPGR